MDFEPNYSETEFAVALVNLFQYYSTFVDQNIIETIYYSVTHMCRRYITGFEIA